MHGKADSRSAPKLACGCHNSRESNGWAKGRELPKASRARAVLGAVRTVMLLLPLFRALIALQPKPDANCLISRQALGWLRADSPCCASRPLAGTGGLLQEQAATPGGAKCGASTVASGQSSSIAAAEHAARLLRGAGRGTGAARAAEQK